MKYFFKISLVVVIITLIGCNFDSTDKSSDKIALEDNYSERIDSLIQIKEPRFFNGVILISKGDDIVYKKEYGSSDFKTEKPISLEDKFRIWSNSKQITAVLILREFEKGNIGLHKPIKEYLPNFNQPWVDSVTVHHLLNM